jgi:hypothetical protein
MAEHPEGPLARLRAALAGPRGVRRIDALLSATDAEAAVASLAPTEVFELVHEVGFADASDLIALATPDQIRGCLDLDAWDKDHALVEPMKPWLASIMDAGFEKLGAVWAGLDPELRALYLQRNTRIYDLGLGEAPDDRERDPEDPDAEDEKPAYMTVDRMFALELLGDEDTVRLTIRLLDDLYRADADLARHTIMAARSELASYLEETSYRWRSGRLADLGYADFYDALELFRPLDAAKVAIGEGTQDRSHAVDANTDVDGDHRALPVAIAEEVVHQGFLARALGRVSDPSESERLEGAILLLVNKVLAAGRAKPGQPEVVRRASQYAIATVSLGLEAIARGDLDRAVGALRSIALLRLFRVGYTITLKLAKLAQSLAPRAATAGSPARELIAGLASPRPLFTRAAEQPPADGLRPFEAQADVRRAAELLTQLAARIALVESLGVNLLAMAQAPEPRAGLDDYIRTALVRVMAGAGAELSSAALRQAELAAWRTAAVDAGAVTAAARAAAHAAIKTRLAAAGARLADEQRKILVDGWIADLEATLAGVADGAIDPRFVDGVLVEARRS